MARREKVQNPLSPGEVFDLAGAINEAVPRNLDAKKVRADLSSKGTLRRDLGTFFRARYALFVDTGLYTRFYREVYNKTVDLSVLLVPTMPEYESWPIVVVPGLITINDRFEVSKKMFGNAWRYTDDLNTVSDIVERPKVPYVAWVQATVEADPGLANISAEGIAKRGLNILTLGERLDLGLQHFYEKKEHLDIESWTLCAGSRYADGSVPAVRWSPASRRLSVGGYGSRVAGPDVRARAEVVPET